MTNLLEHFNIEVSLCTKEKVRILVNVTEEMLQPYGVMHGGMNAVFIETAASLGATEHVTNGYAAGIEVNVNHIRPVKNGQLIIEAVPVHVGKSTQVWSAEIKNEKDKLTATGRMTLMNVKF